MASNKEKLIAAAQKLAEKGQLEKAVKEYLKVVAEDPTDVGIWIKVGDLYDKLGRGKEAIETYQRVANFYAEKGHHNKAVAAWHLVLRTDPRAVDAHQALADLYKQMGLIADAMKHYEALAAHWQREGNPRASLAALKQIVELDPGNVASRIKLAELFSKEQMTREAVDEFSRAADRLKDAGRMDDFMKVAERLLFFAPENRPVGRELAALYIQKGDPRRALPKLQQVLKVDARDVEALGLLCEAFEALGQAPKTVSVLKELARIHKENGDEQSRRDALRRVIALAPDDEEAAQVLGVPPSAPPPAMVHELEEPSLEDALSSDVVEPDVEPAAPMQPGPSFLDEAVDDSTVSESGEEEEIGKILTEADVYTKYGLHQKALEHVQKIFVRQPAHIEAREKLKSIYVTLGRIDEAVNELFTLVKQVGRNTPRGEEYLREVLELQPGNTRARSLLSAGGSQLTPGPARGPVALRTVIDSPAPDRHRPDTGSPADFDIDEVSAVEELSLDDPSLIEEVVEESYDEAIEQAASAPPADLDHPLLHDDALPSLGNDSADDATSGGRPQNVLRAVRAAFPDSAGASALGGRGERPEGGSLEDDLDEADFFIQQNLFDDAREILDGLLGRYPNHPLVLAKLRDLESLENPPPIMAPEPPPGESYADPYDAADGVPVDGLDGLGSGDALDEQSFAPVADAAPEETMGGDVADPLGDPLGDEDPALPPLVSNPGEPDPTAIGDYMGRKKPRKNVVEKGVTPEDFETHYDLGIAYKEMGLLDDAITEFQTVMQDPAREVQCHLMLGLCFVEKGLMTDAISQFKEGLYAEHLQDREQMALYYELGQAYERLNDVREALYYYEKVMKRDANFRDVDGRVRALRGGAGTVTEDPALPVESDLDDAFDGAVENGARK